MDGPVLFPVDDSPCAAAARPHAVAFARRCDATLLALHVVDTSVGRSSVVREPLERRGRALLSSVERRAARAGVAVETLQRTGRPHEEILDAVDERDAAAVAMGTHGRRGVDRLLLGSVTERVVRRAPVPVLTVGLLPAERGESAASSDYPGLSDGPDAATYDAVCLRTDGSEAAAVALEPAVDLAVHDDATLHVLHVTAVETLGYDVRSASVLGDLAEAGRGYVDDLADRAREAGVADVTTAVREGVPSTAICAYADEHDVGCVTMGTDGRTGLRRALIGSTTERVLRTTPRPVLTVPARE
ncbi:MAG: universal stress protein [Halobacteriaceae archaeon]